jgi:glyoxylase-like metal-dependent hydrolase (beta-lactamase superfamily II)
LVADIEEVCDGVFRLTTSEADGFDEVVSRVHSYLVKTSARRYVLVDSGWANSSGDLIGAIRGELGEEIAIERLLLTHLHPDHFGGSKAIVNSYSSKLSYHRKETLHLTYYYGVLRKGMSAAADWLGFPTDVLETVRVIIAASRSMLPEPDSYLVAGETIRAGSGFWCVVHTPGHSPGHVCLYRPSDGTLISGDHILPGETPNVSYYPVPGYHALRFYLASLAEVKRLAPSIALPGHGNIIRDVPKRVETISVHHLERLQEVLRGLRGGVRSAAEVTRSVEWSRGSYESLGHVNRWLAILETISHLEFLVECGVVRRVKGPGRMYQLMGRDWGPVEKAVAHILAP